MGAAYRLLWRRAKACHVQADGTSHRLHAILPSDQFPGRPDPQREDSFNGSDVLCNQPPIPARHRKTACPRLASARRIGRRLSPKPRVGIAGIERRRGLSLSAAVGHHFARPGEDG